MIPRRSTSDAEQTRADSEQTRSDGDQSLSDGDQTVSDRDQGAADLDQLAADQDQAASDVELAAGLDSDAHESSRDTRDRSRHVRDETSRERSGTGRERDDLARERDGVAHERDRAAAERDREGAEADAEFLRLVSGLDIEHPTTGAELILRAGRERQRATADRARAAEHRAQAARDREQAARDRQLAAADRAHAGAEREMAARDTLTGAWRRGPGLAELQREIDRARHGDAGLLVAYVDVDGLKAVNDSRGHSAGDALLKHVVTALQAHLRSYDLVIRMGGDEFLLALSNATVETARHRLRQVSAELTASAEGGSITAGLAELDAVDGAMELINRADGALLAVRADQASCGTAHGSDPRA